MGLNFILKKTISSSMLNIMALVTDRGRASFKIPYNNHAAALPASNKMVGIERSSADLVFIILTTCGKNDTDDNTAPTKPIISSISIRLFAFLVFINMFKSISYIF
ncbi:hypothetical protein Q766_00525 [Flavobacterium subsaxonicum WB 4.1-42 = DSM 21790]|uniref:Uncharacterized protein n=1 Tax=Flavobacterium subsaxonicum WB 4.1-42 = DSM 21790 TaxID=1121898 RepID=A0A0A2MT45_9FLAO|nr:hypothetical protein Q766_00525 [Flavobacterium subsaxonicum WB 4.1-42 = DSM 21790]